MPKRSDIKKIMVIGSGPIVIGQAAEFDYAGTQACLALKEEGYEVVLLNPNPATIMSDTAIADKVYMEPLTLEFASKIIYQENPDAILGTLGGQTGLNLLVELANSKILEKEHVEILGTKLEAIEKAEDREKFKNLMQELNFPIPESLTVEKVEDAITFANTIGYPVVVRPAFTLGGTGGGFAYHEEELKEICKHGLKISPATQCLIEKSIAGYKEIEYEVMRDQKDQSIVVCNMENIDPVGIHTGDSIVVAPTQSLTNKEHKMLAKVSLDIISALQISGGCNVQLALDPNSANFYVIEVNPRVSRSSALASKATGYPIAKIAAKVAVGYTLDEIINPVTNTSYAYFEPTIDYIVTKVPRFPFDKFTNADHRLGTQMKATGEVMAIGQSFEESFLKAIRSLENKVCHIDKHDISNMNIESLWAKIDENDDERIFAIMELIRRGIEIDQLHQITKIDKFFLAKLLHINRLEKELKANPKDLEVLKKVKTYGFCDTYIAHVWQMEEIDVYQLRKNNNIMPVYKMVDTCAAEFVSKTPYFYSTYGIEEESIASDQKKVIVLGSGPIRIGQGVEFDFATVHSVIALRNAGYKAIVINNNPETVSTDFSISDKLYFEPLSIEDVMHVIDLEKPLGVIVQFGGQTAINLAAELEKRHVPILGTSVKNIDKAEDRHEFEKMLKQLQIPHPQGATAMNVEEALIIARSIGYPVLLRPSYVLGGRAMEIIHNDDDLKIYMKNAMKEISHNSPILVDKYIIGKEIEIDAIGDGKEVYIPGIMEHIERAGVHSGDSISVYPTQTLSPKVLDKIIEYTIKIGKGFTFIGLYNIQFIVDQHDEVFILEVNPRSSRTVPFLSKVTNIPMAQVATRAILGDSLAMQGYKEGVGANKSPYVFVKAPVFSFAKLRSVDTLLGPEMKSTGEALGSDITLEKALYKALVASGIKIPDFGAILMTIANEDKEEALALAKRFDKIGYKIYATEGTSKYLKEHDIDVQEVAKVDYNDFDVLDLIMQGKVDFVMNTMSQEKNVHQDGFLIRRIAVENGIPCLTSLDTVSAILKVIEAQSFASITMGEYYE